MNVRTSANGLAGVLRSLNCDRAYAIALIGVIALLALPELLGQPARQIMSFDRPAIAAGQWWRLLSAHFVHLDAQHAALNSLGWCSCGHCSRATIPLALAAIYLGAALAVSAGLWFGIRNFGGTSARPGHFME
jgi:membrane associated rhomboid family serine protease